MEGLIGRTLGIPAQAHPDVGGMERLLMADKRPVDHYASNQPQELRQPEPPEGWYWGKGIFTAAAFISATLYISRVYPSQRMSVLYSAGLVLIGIGLGFVAACPPQPKK